MVVSNAAPALLMIMMAHRDTEEEEVHCHLDVVFVFEAIESVSGINQM